MSMKKIESRTYILSTLWPFNYWQPTLHLHLQPVTEKTIEVPQQGLKTIDPSQALSTQIIPTTEAGTTFPFLGAFQNLRIECYMEWPAEASVKLKF